jgi:uncharacterized protein YlxW (UPF0749 family)
MARSPVTLPAQRETRSRRIALPNRRLLVLSLLLALVGLAGGSVLSLKWQDKSTAAQQPITRESNPQLVQSTITKLEADQADLKRALADARDQLDDLEANSAQEKAQLADVTGAISDESTSAGLVPLTGPGVIATFRDSSDAAVPQGEDPANYILHDYNLRDIVNTLWASGAEAISINGERILSTTSIYCVGTTIICNITRLSPPYEVRAIGDPTALAAGLRTAPQMQQFLTHAQIYDLPVDIQQPAAVSVPAYSGAVTFKYAHPGDSAGAPTATSSPPGH